MAGKKTTASDISIKTLNELIEKHRSCREFARVILEDPSDVLRWKHGKIKIHPRAVVTIVRMFGTEPEQLRPDLFKDVGFVFKNKGEKK